MGGAADLFAKQLAATPRASVDPADLEALPTFGLGGVLAARPWANTGPGSPDMAPVSIGD